MSTRGVWLSIRIPAMAAASVLAALVCTITSSAAFATSSTWQWGKNGGEFLPPNTEPLPVSALEGEGVTQLGGGYYSEVALLGNGTVDAWGFNIWGELGSCDESIRETRIPTPVCGITEATGVAAGEEFDLAVLRNGTVKAWGADGSGQLGNGRTDSSDEEPREVSGFGGVTSVAAGLQHSVALRSDGSVWAWGASAGNGQPSASDVPVQVCAPEVASPCAHGPYLTNVAAIAAGANFSLALLRTGEVVAWGGNGDGQLGNGTQTGSLTPVYVCAVGATAPCGAGSRLTGITAIAAGYEHGMALTNETVVDWGGNDTGQLGNGGLQSSDVPVSVGGLSGVSAIASGSSSYGSFAILGNGTVKGWGNLIGHSSAGSTSPTTVSGLSNVTAVGGGWYFALAAGGLPQWHANGGLVGKTKRAISQVGSLTIENPTTGKLKCRALLGGSVWNSVDRGLWNDEALATYACSSEPSCEGSFLSDEEPPVPVVREETNSNGERVKVPGAERGKSYLPYAGEVAETSKEARLVVPIRLTLVEPCKGLQVPLEGTLRAIWQNGYSNGLHRSHAVLEGKGGKTGFLTSPALPTENEGNIVYVSGELATSGIEGVELITAE